MQHSKFHAVWLQNSLATVKEAVNGATFVGLVFTRETADNVSDAACDMDKGTFLAERKTRGNRESQTDGFGEEGSATEVAVDDEACGKGE